MRIQVAQSLVQDRRFDEALGRLLAIPDDKRGAEGNFAIGRVYAFREEWANARKFLDLALAATARQRRGARALVQVDAREGKLQRLVRSHPRRAQRATPTTRSSRSCSARSRPRPGAGDDAEAAFRKAIEIDPNGLGATPAWRACS